MRLRSLMILILVLFAIAPVIIAGPIIHTQSYEETYNVCKQDLEERMDFCLRTCEFYNTKVEEGILTKQEAISEIATLLAGPLQPDGTRNMSRSLSKGKSGYVFADFSNGTYAFHPYLPAQGIMGVYDLPPDLKKSAEKLLYTYNRTFEIQMPWIKERGLSSIALCGDYFEPFDLHLAVLESMEEFTAPVNVIRSAIIIAAIIAGVVGVIVSLFVARLVSKPFTELSKTSNKIAKGDLSARIDVKSSIREFGEVSEDINRMVGTLERDIEGLREALGSYSKVLNEVALGNLTARVDTEQLKGEYGLLGETLNSIITIMEFDTDELKKKDAELGEALTLYGYTLEKLVDEGELSARIDTDKLKGKHKLIGTDINLLIGGLQTKIEESKKREIEAKKTKDQLDLIIETSPSPLILTDEEGRFIKVNRALEQIVGFDRKELLGKTSFEQPFHTKETIDALKKLWKFTVEHREEAIEGMDVPWKTKDGRTVIIRGVEAPFGKGEGRLFAGIEITEVHKRKR